MCLCGPHLFVNHARNYPLKKSTALHDKMRCSRNGCARLKSTHTRRITGTSEHRRGIHAVSLDGIAVGQWRMHLCPRVHVLLQEVRGGCDRLSNIVGVRGRCVFTRNNRSTTNKRSQFMCEHIVLAVQTFDSSEMYFPCCA